MFVREFVRAQDFGVLNYKINPRLRNRLFYADDDKKIMVAQLVIKLKYQITTIDKYQGKELKMEFLIYKQKNVLI